MLSVVAGLSPVFAPHRPQDVLATLLNNLKVQERQNRVCTTVAIAIVAETCSPFTVLPALMNEYRVPELNVQNGVLKSLSFMFEYIGEMGKDYVYAVTPLLEDALMDRYGGLCTSASYHIFDLPGFHIWWWFSLSQTLCMSCYILAVSQLLRRRWPFSVLCSHAGTWCTAKRHAGRSNTWPWACTGLALRTP